MIIQYFLPILEPYFTSELMDYWYLPVLCLAFIATVPFIFKYLLR